MTLVFPQAKPYGAHSASSKEAIRDESAHPTQVIDYLKLDIYGHQNNDLQQSIYLYLPHQLQEEYTADYEGVTLGAVGAAAVQTAIDGLAEGGLPDDFGQTISDAAESGKPMLGFRAGSEVLNKVIGAQSLGGSQISTQGLSALVQKKIFNPYEEVLYKGTTFRNHAWSLTMVPKSAKEVKTIYDIIHTLRKAVLPGKDGTNWLTIPEYFRASIVRYVDATGTEEELSDPNNSGGFLNALMQFPAKMVCKRVNVQFQAAGAAYYTSLRSMEDAVKYLDYGPTAYQLSLDFQETSYLTKESFDKQQEENTGYYNNF